MSDIVLSSSKIAQWISYIDNISDDEYLVTSLRYWLIVISKCFYLIVLPPPEGSPSKSPHLKTASYSLDDTSYTFKIVNIFPPEYLDKIVEGTTND